MIDLKIISDELHKAVIDNEDTLYRLREENKRLKDDHYKDEELQLMKNKLEEFQEDLARGFPIWECDQIKIDKWVEEHKKKCPYCYFQYIFTPTEIVDFGEIKCCRCGDIYTFQER